MIGSVTDGYNPYEESFRRTRKLLEELHGSNRFWNDMKGFNWVLATDNFFTFSDSLRNRSKQYEQIVLENEFFVSAHVVGNGRASLLFVSNIPESIKQSDVWSLINEIFSKGYTQSEKDYGGVIIRNFTRSGNPNDKSFFVALNKGVIIFSTTQLLLESAINQMDSQISLMDDARFKAIVKTAGTRVVANVFINHLKLPMLLQQQIHPIQRKGFGNLSRIGSWSELDLAIRDDSFFLNGFGQVSDTLNTF